MCWKSIFTILVFLAGLSVIDSQTFQAPGGATGGQFSFDLSPFPREAVPGIGTQEFPGFRRFGQTGQGTRDTDLQIPRFSGNTLDDLPPSQRADVLRQLRANGITVSGSGTGTGTSRVRTATRGTESLGRSSFTVSSGTPGGASTIDISRSTSPFGTRRILVGSGMDNTLTPRRFRVPSTSLTGTSGFGNQLSFRGMPSTFGTGRFGSGDTTRMSTAFSSTPRADLTLPRTGILRGIRQNPNALFIDPVSGQTVRIMSNNAASSFVSRRTSSARPSTAVRRMPTVTASTRMPTIRRRPTMIRRTTGALPPTMPRTFRQTDPSFGTTALRSTGLSTQFNDFGFAPLAIPLDAPTRSINALPTTTGDTSQRRRSRTDWSLFNSVLAQNGLVPGRSRNGQTTRQFTGSTSSTSRFPGSTNRISLDSLDLSMFDPASFSSPVAAAPVGTQTPVSFGSSFGSRTPVTRFEFGAPGVVSTSRFDLTRPSVVNRRVSTSRTRRPSSSTSSRTVMSTMDSSRGSFASTNRLPRVSPGSTSRVNIDMRRTDSTRTRVPTKTARPAATATVDRTTSTTGRKSMTTSTGKAAVTSDMSKRTKSRTISRPSGGAASSLDITNTITNVDTKISPSDADVPVVLPIIDSGVPIAPWEFNTDGSAKSSSSSTIGSTRVIDIEVPSDLSSGIDTFGGNAVDVLNSAVSSSSSSGGSSLSSSSSLSTLDSIIGDTVSLDANDKLSTGNSGASSVTRTTVRRVVNPGDASSSSNSVVTITSNSGNTVTKTETGSTTKETLDINKQLSAIEKQLRNAANSDKPVFAIIPMNAEANKANFQDFIDNLASNKNIVNRTTTVTEVKSSVPSNDINTILDKIESSTLPSPISV